MKILIVEDDYVSSALLKAILTPYGQCDVASDGRMGVTMFCNALTSINSYTLVCLDIMLPELDGQDVLREIRRQEELKGIKGLDGVKIVMMTALSDHRNIMNAFTSQCEGYLIKPIRKDKVVKQLKDLGLIQTMADAGDRHNQQG
jgi:two-component system, chemotaxis family, chemotaxis protein CheY